MTSNYPFRVSPDGAIETTSAEHALLLRDLIVERGKSVPEVVEDVELDETPKPRPARAKAMKAKPARKPRPAASEEDGEPPKRGAIVEAVVAAMRGAGLRARWSPASVMDLPPPTSANEISARSLLNRLVRRGIAVRHGDGTFGLAKGDPRADPSEEE